MRVGSANSQLSSSIGSSLGLLSESSVALMLAMLWSDDEADNKTESKVVSNPSFGVGGRGEAGCPKISNIFDACEIFRDIRIK